MNAEDYTMHGWRYTAAEQLANAGATDAEIAAITGHRSLQMIAKYSRKTNQKKLAKNAQLRRSNGHDATSSKREHGKQSGKLENDQ